jgi:hypothetical protein
MRINLAANYNVGIDLGDNSQRINANQQLVLEKFGTARIRFNSSNGNVEIINGYSCTRSFAPDISQSCLAFGGRSAPGMEDEPADEEYLASGDHGGRTESSSLMRQLHLESGDRLTYAGNRANLAGFEAQVGVMPPQLSVPADP